jgi:hypothetical protein
MVIEVFKTNVWNREYANFLLRIIEHVFTNYEANFDLDDCDRILRIKSKSGLVNADAIIHLLKDFHVNAEILPDDLVTDVNAPAQMFASIFLKNDLYKN